MQVTDPKGRAIEFEVSPLVSSDGQAISIVSIRDPHSSAPAKRITSDGDHPINPDDMVGSGAGLVVFGRSRSDRASLASVWLHHDRAAAAAVIEDCVRRGVGYEEPLVAEAVRKKLGLSQAEIGLKMGMAPDNLDPARRRQNVARSVRRYETDGGPPTVYAMALRWMAVRAGLIDTAAIR